MQTSKDFRINVGDDELSVVEWEGEGDPVLLLHATGFHSRCWNQVVKHLPGQHIYAVDLRFHGASGDSGDVDWARMSEDIQVLIRRLELTNLVGVGHSIGGHLMARTAAALPDRFKQLVLIDPVIMSPEHYRRFHDFAETINPADHPVSRRKNQWQDTDEMFERFHDRAPFNTWQPEVLRDYCEHALRPSSDAEYLQLACDPINEASIYLTHLENEVVHRELPGISTPVTLLRAPVGKQDNMDLSSSPTWPELATVLPCCREIYLPEMNHFIPMQDPQLVAGYILEAQEGRWQVGLAPDTV